jgi:hypothetical protein
MTTDVRAIHWATSCTVHLRTAGGADIRREHSGCSMRPPGGVHAYSVSWGTARRLPHVGAAQRKKRELGSRTPKEVGRKAQPMKMVQVVGENVLQLLGLKEAGDFHAGDSRDAAGDVFQLVGEFFVDAP